MRLNRLNAPSQTGIPVPASEARERVSGRASRCPGPDLGRECESIPLPPGEVRTARFGRPRGTPDYARIMASHSHRDMTQDTSSHDSHATAVSTSDDASNTDSGPANPIASLFDIPIRHPDALPYDSSQLLTTIRDALADDSEIQSVVEMAQHLRETHGIRIPLSAIRLAEFQAQRRRSACSLMFACYLVDAHSMWRKHGASPRERAVNTATIKMHRAALTAGAVAATYARRARYAVGRVGDILVHGATYGRTGVKQFVTGLFR